MTRPPTLLVAAIAAAGVAVAVVVVLTRSSATSHPGASASAERDADVRVARTKLGPILVDAHGHTLYLFLKDPYGRSSCYGACAQIWPPALASGSPLAGAGVATAKLTTAPRRDRTRQLVYNGHPLYALDADTRPGEMQGEGFLGTWFAVSPAGHRVAEPGTSSFGGY